eukprot:984934-Rhodomonas_salina.1
MKRRRGRERGARVGAGAWRSDGGAAASGGAWPHSACRPRPPRRFSRRRRLRGVAQRRLHPAARACELSVEHAIATAWAHRTAHLVAALIAFTSSTSKSTENRLPRRSTLFSPVIGESAVPGFRHNVLSHPNPPNQSIQSDRDCGERMLGTGGHHSVSRLTLA